MQIRIIFEIVILSLASKILHQVGRNGHWKLCAGHEHFSSPFTKSNTHSTNNVCVLLILNIMKWNYRLDIEFEHIEFVFDSLKFRTFETFINIIVIKVNGFAAVAFIFSFAGPFGVFSVFFFSLSLSLPWIIEW